MRGRTATLSFALGVAAVAAATAVAAGAAPEGECDVVRPGAGASRCYGTLPPVRTTLVLASRNRSGQRGVAQITFGIHQTKVVLKLRGAASGARQAAHLHSGACGAKGPVIFDLGDVVNGRRTVTLDPFTKKIKYFSVDVHASGDDSAVAACGTKLGPLVAS
jgi:predicted small lipoprotein YifL